jgi:hypothetical protein
MVLVPIIPVELSIAGMLGKKKMQETEERSSPEME